jgi:hypothetical protein
MGVSANRRRGELAIGRAKNSARRERRFVEKITRAGFEPRRVIGSTSRFA